MKKTILSVVLVAVAAISANAQTWVSATVSLDNSKSENDETSYSYKYLNMPISVSGAYQFADNQMAGIALNCTLDNTNTEYTLDMPDGQGGTIHTTTKNNDTNTSFSVSPFYWYKLIEWKGIDVWGEASATVGKGLLGFSLTPVLTYGINENISFVGAWNVLGLVYSRNESGNTTTQYLNFGANRNAGVSLGFMYKF